jgi:tRNA pseudouridine38-40 synthase
MERFMPRRIQLIVEYDGTEFHGWQLQSPGEVGSRTVQGVIEETLSRIAGSAVRIAGASRTDAGVHAIGQSATFDLADDCSVPTERLADALNAWLPPDVFVRQAIERPADFHAQGSSCGKVYRYLLVDTRRRAPLLRRTHWLVRYPLDVDAMREAAGALVGAHDFSAFVTELHTIQARRAEDEKEALSTVRHITGVNVTERYLDEFGVREIAVRVEGVSFLYKMVRTIVGSLVEVGRGRFSPEWLGEVLASKDRRRAGPTAPPQGLTLMDVVYDRKAGISRQDVQD